MRQAKFSVAPTDTSSDGADSSAPFGLRNRAIAAVSRTVDSLRHPGYRYIWGASMLGMGGFQMQTIARTVFVDDLTGVEA